LALPFGFKDELLLRTDIVDLISSYLTLKRSGANYWGLCPFHNEKTPSFSVSPEKQIFKCFGCGEGGDAISFVMKMDGLSYMEAIKKLCSRCGMTLPEEQNSQARAEAARRAKLLELCRDAALHYHSLLKTPDGAKAADYLRKRGIRPATVTAFGLGWGGSGWRSLADAMKKKGYTEQQLLDAGLCRRGQKGGIYDVFRNRLIFPIISSAGVIAFGGRILEGEGAKYINSSDTPLFNKSQNLFAMNLARKTKRDFLILAEGYMDVISLHQAGFDCAVASLGTALTPDQGKMIARKTGKVIICYDSDNAGRNAAKKAIDILSKEGLEIRVLSIPGAKDPDEFIRKNGAEAFEKLLVKPMNDTEYKLSGLKAGRDLKDDNDRIAYLGAAVKVIAARSNPVEREIYSRRVAEETSISPAAVEAAVKKERSAFLKRDRRELERSALNPASSRTALRIPTSNPSAASAEERLIFLCLSEPELLRMAEDEITENDFSTEYLGRIFKSAGEKLAETGRISPAMCVSELPEHEAKHLTELLMKGVRSQDPKAELRDCIGRIKTENIFRSGTDDALLEALNMQRNRQGAGYGGTRKK